MSINSLFFNYRFGKLDVDVALLTQSEAYYSQANWS